MPCYSIFDSLISLCCRLVAALAARSTINRVVIANDSVFKHRRWHADWLRIPGNLLLRFRAAPVKVLSREQWIERESQIAAATRIDGGLRLPKVDGVPLASFLAGSESRQRKKNAICIAIRALFDFHQQTGQSHGDASATNVMITQAGHPWSATWFDFDVAHSGDSSKLNRADDLRAILSTAQVCEFDALLTNAYPDDEIWESAIALIAKGPRDIFHLAQQKRCSLAVAVASRRNR